MEAFYETLATMMNNFDFPIVLLQDLAPRGSTCPTEAYGTYERETIMKISRALYQKLLGVIPHMCTIMHNLLANHTATHDLSAPIYRIYSRPGDPLGKQALLPSNMSPASTPISHRNAAGANTTPNSKSLPK
jgi:hypothetical protein